MKDCFMWEYISIMFTCHSTVRTETLLFAIYYHTHDRSAVGVTLTDAHSLPALGTMERNLSHPQKLHISQIFHIFRLI